MRKQVLAATLATAALVGYLYAPQVIESLYGDAALESAAPKTEVLEPTGIDPRATPGGDQAAVNAGLTNLKDSVAPAAVPTRPKLAPRAEPRETPKAKQRPSRRTRRLGSDERGDEQSALRALGIVPAAKKDDLARQVDEPKLRPITAKDLANPMSSRWVNDLSGPEAKLDMGVEKVDGGCKTAARGCERPEAPKDINVAGVVVRTERLVRKPTAPLQGKVATGHYADHTPAVFVE
jgi:hypothetical protein